MRSRRLLLALVASAITAVCVVLAVPVGAAWAADPRLVITGVQAETGSLRFLLTGRDLAAGTVLDPATVQVRVGAALLRSEAKVATTATAGPARGVVAVLDLTGSNSSGVAGQAKAALGALATALPADVKLGLVIVTGTARLEVVPTVDRAAFTKAVGTATPSGSGSLLTGVMTAIDALATGGFGEGDRRVVLVSGGAQTNSGIADATQQENLTRRSVPVDVLALSATTLGTARLRAYAEATRGRQLSATDHAGAVSAASSSAGAFPPVLVVTAFVPDQLAETSSTLDVVAGGVRGSTLVRFGPPLPGARPVPVAPSPLAWIPPWAVYAVAAIVFLAVGGLVLAVVWPQSATTARIRQIELFGPARAMPVARPEPAGSPGNAIARTAIAATASVVRSGPLEERIAVRLERAGMKLRPPEWVLLRVCVTVGSGLLLFLLTDWIGAILGLLLGWLGTVLYLSLRVDRRASVFAEQLPDALQLVIGSLKSGFSLPQALESLVRESPDPVASEFGRAQAEHKLGADVSDALERVAQRTGSDDLGWAVMAVRIQREVGGNLAEVLQTTVDTMRERGRLRRHVRSLSAEGRLSAWVLIGLPIALGLFMFFYRRQYMAPLFTDPMGLTMLLGGSVLFVIGIIWMSRVIKVDA